MNGPFRLEAASWSPVESIVADEPEAARPHRGPSLLFAVTVIAGVALLTGGGIAMFYIEPSQGAPDEQPAIAAAGPAVTADALAVTASLAVPVHKVTTRSISVAPASDEPQPVATDTAVKAQDVDELQQQDPRWARTGGEKSVAAFASVLQPPASTNENGAVPAGVTALAGETPSSAEGSKDGTETAAIAPDEILPKDEIAPPKQASRTKAKQPAAEAAVDDNSALPPGVTGSARTVQVVKGANMRARPKSGSGIVTVVPKGAAVQLVSCKVWCEIVYNGQRGYVFKDFVGGGTSASTAKSTKTKTVFTVDAKDPEPAAPATAETTSTPRVKPMSSRLQ